MFTRKFTVRPDIPFSKSRDTPQESILISDRHPVGRVIGCKNLTPYSQPIRSQTKNNSDLDARVFLSFRVDWLIVSFTFVVIGQGDYYVSPFKKLLRLLRTLPSFVTAHTFCASWDDLRYLGFLWVAVTDTRIFCAVYNYV